MSVMTRRRAIGAVAGVLAIASGGISGRERGRVDRDCALTLAGVTGTRR
jgi:hypothetical protein